MDTRTKIVGRSADAADTSVCATVVVSGYFDPLTAAHVRRLAELRSGADRLVVAVVDPPEPVLPAQARAELVAALACVDEVVLGAPAHVDFREELADLERRANLIAAVQARCSRPCQA